jgi:hypothetical protein
VYILTDGIWGSTNSAQASNGGTSSTSGVDRSIETLVERMKAQKLVRGHITLQFIRFGHNRVGKKRLRYLDNEMKEMIGWDIVDRRYFDRGVRPMLIGALSEDQDIESDDSDIEDPDPVGTYS